MKHKEQLLFQDVTDLELKILDLAKEYSLATNIFLKEKLKNDITAHQFLMDRKTKALLKLTIYEKNN